MSLAMQVRQTYVIKFIVEEGMKGVKSLTSHCRSALQRRQVDYWIKELKSERKGLFNILAL
jgi:hypothetical protein